MDKDFSCETSQKTMKITCAAFMLLIQTLRCLASDDSPFQLTNTAGFCLVKTNNKCDDIRWTSSERLLVPEKKKCVGAQGKSVGSEISIYDCDENSDLQKWECKNGTVLALKGQELYIELTADNRAVLSRTIGPNNQLTISGTSSGACSRTYRELFAIGGNAAGMPCMFPFHYKDQWFSDCTTFEAGNSLWCAVETKFQSERWGYCPVTTKIDWTVHPTTGAYYQLNTQAALTWNQAEVSCKQQGATLLSITDPHEQAYVTALLGSSGSKLWLGLILDPEHGWKWHSGRPYRYLKWDSGHPLLEPGNICSIIDPAVQFSWQSSPCSKKLGYICYSKAADAVPTQAIEQGFCSRPWIPYNGHCFHLNRTQRIWTDAQRECRSLGGDLVSIRNVEDQSFLISSLEYTSTDELWIGLNDRKTEGLFEWIDHADVSFTSWEFGKPVVSTQVNDCVLIRGEKGNWADRACGEKHGSICMKMSALKPPGDVAVVSDAGCKSRWRRHGSYCYFVGTQAKTFDEAKADCTSSGSYLVDVSSALDNAYLVSLVGLRPEKHFWLGLSNQKKIDQFVWTNKDSVWFTHWNADMPGHIRGCVAMTTGVFAGLWDVLPCTKREKYICKYLADGAAPTSAPETPAPTGTCKDGWTRLESRPYCFKMFPESSSSSSSSSSRRSWFNARDYCRTIGGDLLSIHSSSELEALPERYGRLWIGLSAPDPTNGYVWSDGSPLQFQHWQDDEPNNKNNVESCAEMLMHQRDSRGSWNDLHCETALGWLCQIRIGVTPKAPPRPPAPDHNRTKDGWFDRNGTQYYFNSRSMAMEEARRYCQQQHGDLVSIGSEDEAVYLWKQISKNYGSYWIGLNVDLDKTYSWMDGSPVVFQRWDEDQPVFLRNDENCAAMTNSMGFWHDFNCGYEHKSICKRSGTPDANATVAPTVAPKGGCPHNWMKMDSKCYNVVNKQSETWEGAKTQCKAMQGNLASISSRRVQLFLTTKLAEAPTINLWIGLKKARGSSFFWTDGRPMRYNNWGEERSRMRRSFQMYEDYDMYRHHRPSYSYEKSCAMMTTDSETGIGKWIKKSCNDTYGYICIRKIDANLPDSPEPTIAADYVKMGNDSIKIVTQKKNWEDANKFCESEGASLASMRNEWSRVYIEMMALNLKVPMWIGLNKNKTGGYFRYIGGWRMNYANWDRREPSSNQNQNCVYVTEDGKWKTSDCNENMASICMKTTDVAPTDSSDFPGYCPEDQDNPNFRSSSSSRHMSMSMHRHRPSNAPSWLPYRAHCYLFSTDRIEWPSASANCMIHGGNLASIEDPAEQEFIYSSIQTYRDSQSAFWIGLYKTHRGTWQWLDKSVMDFSNWRQGQPDENNYGSIKTTDGKWATGSRWYDRGYICKVAKVLRENPKPTESPIEEQKTRGRVTLAVVLVITVMAIGIATAWFFFKKSGGRLPIPEKLSTFDNPLFFNNERSPPDLVDTNKLVENAEEENPAPVITV
ncbi:macrophage mannose receptor 1-like [Centropristis striata]|uniref:macrophage mannose receptor 1-like n=1 Tax=Centropristis striata TaxID=184440 RepID=UPI0027E1CBCB|nr:macrophage mannose receptor 1-like [Centropristis striata]